MVKILTKNGYEYFTHFDSTAKVFEIFLDTEGETYIGCADTRDECIAIAKKHATDNA